ncbi:MAG: hypothetical protein F4Y75_02270 [Acidimicrobiia bacterium]|nr:hypothetical protein [bacterium]MXX63505.1 hypothetical protein [Acidimicrobiia bacterium]MCY3580829.1 hypothetical protein [bacterium]MCY3653071.1 hypothetical protein [bacterium]MDE0644448.1 hypothetical protein [bacterium]
MIDERDQEFDKPSPPPEPSSSAPVGDIHNLIAELVLALNEAKTIPGANRVLIDRDQMMGVIELLQERLPEEMRTARWMVREREIFIDRTNEKAREIISRARSEAAEMVANTQIIAEATEEANILVRRAEDRSRRIRLEAEDYAEDRLSRLEDGLIRVLDQVRAMRTELHQSTRPPGR